MPLIKIKMLTRSAGPSGNYSPGDIRDVIPAEAERLVSAGFALYEFKPAETAETTEAIEPVETAAETTKPRRGRMRR